MPKKHNKANTEINYFSVILWSQDCSTTRIV